MTWDLIVVGAGVLGTFHALFAAERGVKTLLIERDDGPRSASVRNFGMIIAGAQEPGIWRERAVASSAIYHDLAQRVPFPLRHRGTHYVANTAAEVKVLKEFASVGPSMGYSCILQEAEQARTVNPLLDPDYCRAALLFPEDFTVDARSLFPTLLCWMVEQLGCDYRPHTTVIAVERHGDGCRLRTADYQELLARQVIICNGSDFRTLFPTLYTAHGLTACKLQMMRTVPQPCSAMSTALALGLSLRRYGAFTIVPSYAQLVEETMDPFLAEKGIHVLLAQNPAGEMLIGDSHQYMRADETPDEQLDMAIDAAILAYARRAVRLPTWEISSRWYGIYPVHPIDEFLHVTIDEHIQVITGIGGKGMTCGPALARDIIERSYQH